MCEVGYKLTSLTEVLHEDKNKTTGRESEREQAALRIIRVKTVHTVKGSSINAPTCGYKLNTTYTFFMCVCVCVLKFTSIIKICIVEIAKSTAL